MALKIEESIEIINNRIDETLGKAGLLIERQAKKNAPTKNSALRDSINTQVDTAEHCAYVGTGVEYAPYVEFGTGIYAVKGDGRKDAWHYQTADGEWHTTHGMAAQPFLQPAADEVKDEIEKMFEGII